MLLNPPSPEDRVLIEEGRLIGVAPGERFFL